MLDIHKKYVRRIAKILVWTADADPYKYDSIYAISCFLDEPSKDFF